MVFYWLIPYPNKMDLWPHSTIFPPYFVAGALFSGFAMVLTLAIPLRHFFGLQDFITERHLGNAAKIILATRWLVAYGYFMEIFTAYYSADQYDIYMTGNRMHGPYAPVYWALMIGARDLAFPRLNLLSW